MTYFFYFCFANRRAYLCLRALGGGRKGVSLLVVKAGSIHPFAKVSGLHG